MIIKEFNSTTYVFIEKNKYIQLKYYYEEILRIKFNKKQHSSNPAEEIKSKLKQLKN